MSARPKRLVILHSRAAPRGARHHMVSVITDHLTAMGIEVVDVYGTAQFEPADGVFVHVDLSLVPRAYAHFAQKYPIQFNAAARDIRKRRFVDGLLTQRDDYRQPVIVKSDLNYGGEPEFNEQTRFERGVRRLRRVLNGAPAANIFSKSDYRIFPTLRDVPRHYFHDQNIVQKLVLEKDGEKNVLREYIFLGNLHYENIERADTAIITDGEHISCLSFQPHPRLLNLRRRLKLDYGKIDFVMVDDEPFIFDANKTLGVGDGIEPYADDYAAMILEFAREINTALRDPDYRSGLLTDAPDAVSGTKTRSARFPHAARTIARA